MWPLPNHDKDYKEQTASAQQFSSFRFIISEMASNALITNDLQGAPGVVN